MRIVFFCQFMPDPCGAFFHDVILARALQARGHQVTFVVTHTKHPRTGVYRGIPFVNYQLAGAQLNGADIWSTPHNPILQLVRKLNETYEKPLVVNMHYGEDLQFIANCPRAGKWAEFLWIVSDHCKQKMLERITPASSFVDFRVFKPAFIQNEVTLYDGPAKTQGDCITLINANLLKGLRVLVELAQRFPNRKFLGVRPYYNRIPVPDLPNLEWMGLQDDIRTVLAKTRVLIVPSVYESWGRVAFEAMYNGIPVLYTKPLENGAAPGVIPVSTESMAAWIKDNGIPCELMTLDDWIAAIQTLDDPEVYADYSNRAWNCTHDMNAFDEIAVVEQKFFEYGTRYQAPKKTKGEDAPQINRGPVMPNRFMGGVGLRMPARRPAPAQVAQPAPQPQQQAPQQPQQRQAPRMSSLGLPGGRFGMRR
jgi:hypothetical protein